jgi:hypothetical protein
LLFLFLLSICVVAIPVKMNCSLCVSFTFPHANKNAGTWNFIPMPARPVMEAATGRQNAAPVEANKKAAGTDAVRAAFPGLYRLVMVGGRTAPLTQKISPDA